MHFSTKGGEGSTKVDRQEGGGVPAIGWNKKNVMNGNFGEGDRSLGGTLAHQDTYRSTDWQ